MKDWGEGEELGPGWGLVMENEDEENLFSLLGRRGWRRMQRRSKQ